MDGETLTVDDELPLTDELIADLVLKALHASPYGRLRHLQAYCDNGRVTLQGRLPTYYLKQVAQVLIDAVPGVRDVDNDVSVFNPRWGAAIKPTAVAPRPLSVSVRLSFLIHRRPIRHW